MSRAAIDMEAEVTMMRPTSSSAATNPSVTESQAKGMRSRARTPYDMVAVAHGAAPFGTALFCGAPLGAAPGSAITAAANTSPRCP